MYTEDASDLKALHGGNSIETAEVRLFFLSVTMAHVLIIFLEDHTASLFI